MKWQLGGWNVLIAAGLASFPAIAHHSAAMFDSNKTVKLTGDVVAFQYTNPHSWLMIMVHGKDGKTVEWGFEGQGPSTLLRQNIHAQTFKPGEKVTVTGHPMKDGRPAASMMQIISADGTIYGYRAKSATKERAE